MGNTTLEKNVTRQLITLMRGGQSIKGIEFHLMGNWIIVKVVFIYRFLKKNYVKVGKYYLHRLIAEALLEKMNDSNVVDHINGDTANNYVSN